MTAATRPSAPAGDRAGTNGTCPLARALAACRAAFFAVTVFSFAINVLLLTVPIYMTQLFDRVLASRSTETLLVLTAIAAFALIVLGIIEAARSRVALGIGSWLDRQLARPVLEASVRHSLRAPASPGVNGLRDLATLRSFIAGPAMLPLLDSPWMPVFGVLIFVLHPLLGWIALGGAAILIVVGVVNEIVTRKSLEQAHGASVRLLSEAEAAVHNADTVEAMGMMRAFGDRWAHENACVLAMHSRVDGWTGTSAALSKTVRFSLQVAMLGAGAWLALEGEITAGVMIAGSILMTRALAPVEQTIGSYRTLIAAWSSYRRLARQLRSAPERKDSMPLPVPRGRLMAEGAYYVHPGAREPVIRGISFALEAGETLGIIGPSGSGKTTLARMVIGNLRPSAGHVRLDGADVAGWDSGDRGRHVGYVAQTAVLFAGTVRENIARMAEASPEAVIEAARLAGVHELILRLPEGYETEIFNGGQNLSGGERQRIALARALYDNPRLVVLDEPNSSLDTAGEEALVGAIERLRGRGVTSIVISHRPSVLRQVDRILVLRDGQISALGPRDEILKRVSVVEPMRQVAAAHG